MDFGGCEHFLTFFNFEVILKDFSPEGPRAQNQHSLTCRHRRSRIRRVNMFRPESNSDHPRRYAP